MSINRKPAAGKRDGSEILLGSGIEDSRTTCDFQRVARLLTEAGQLVGASAHAHLALAAHFACRSTAAVEVAHG